MKPVSLTHIFTAVALSAAASFTAQARTVHKPAAHPSARAVHTPAAPPSPDMTIDDAANVFGAVTEAVKDGYVSQPDIKKVTEDALKGLMAKLDPHSQYMTAEELQDMQSGMAGRAFGGLGMEVGMKNGLVEVITPIDDTPADQAGIQTGDLITKIDDEAVKGHTLDYAVDKMHGALNTQIKLEVLRPDAVDPQKFTPLHFTLTRAEIKMASVKGDVVDGDIAYIRITQFGNDTEDGVEAKMEELKGRIGEKFKGVIIDLRNNPGGLLDQAIDVSDNFLDSGDIVSVRGRDPRDIQVFSAHFGDIAEGKPMAVLINGGSASASEIVSGALQDHKRATLIGTKSFGKGSVQTITPLGQLPVPQGPVGKQIRQALEKLGGALRLTTARYFTPSGTSIQRLGITPDIESIEPGEPKFETSEAEQEGAIDNINPAGARTPGGTCRLADGVTAVNLKAAGIKPRKIPDAKGKPLDAPDVQLACATDIVRGTSGFTVTGPYVAAPAP